MKKITNEQKINFIYFLIKAIIIGIIFFIIIEIGASFILNKLNSELSLENANTFSKDFIGHYYCGTFFIEMLISKNFKSLNAYNTFINMTKLSPIISYISIIITIIILFLIYIIFKRIKNKDVLKKNTSEMIIFLGILYLINNIIAEISYLEIRYLKEYATSFLATTSYYPQIYHIFAIPIIIISTGLIFKHYELSIKKENTKKLDNIIKILIVIISSVSVIFIAYRLGVRVFELTATILNKHISIRLPYYGYMMDLPYDYALSQSGYLKLVLFRFIKDLPCFIASIISITLFIKILISSLKNHINTSNNIKRINISLVSLLISSLIFNILGIYEINILHNNFIEPFNNAVYTIAVRSFCEPLIYGLVLYFMKIFIQTIPKEN